MKRLVPLVLIAAIAGCAGRGGDPETSGENRGGVQEPMRFPVRSPVALAPLENLSGNPRAPEMIARLLDNALREAGVKVAGHLEGSLPSDRFATPVELQQAAAAIGARYVLSGSVLEYGFRKNTPAGEPPEPIVSFELRLLEVSTGRIAWRGGLHGTSDRLFGRTSGIGSVSLGLTHQAAAALAPTRKPASEETE